MRTLTVISALITALAVVALLGCGGDDKNDQSKSPSESLAQRVSVWRSSAGTYNATLQTCRVLPGERNVIAACTRKVRTAFLRETARLNEALRAARPTSPECERAVAKVKTLSAELTDRLTRANRYYVAAERAHEDKAKYSGPPLIPFLGRTGFLVNRDGKVVGRLSGTIRQACAE